MLGEYASAKELLQEGLDIKRETGNRSAMINSLMQLGNVTRELGEYDESSRWYSQALALAWELQAHHMARYIIGGAAELLALQGQPERALEQLFFVQHQPIGEQSLVDQIDDLIAGLAVKLPPDTVTRCRERGQAMTLEAIVADICDRR